MTHSALCMVSCVGLASMWSFWLKGQQRQRPHIMLLKLKKHRGAISPWCVTKTHKTNATNKHRQAKKIFCLISLFIPKLFTSVKKKIQKNIKTMWVQSSCKLFSALRWAFVAHQQKINPSMPRFISEVNLNPSLTEQRWLWQLHVSPAAESGQWLQAQL